MAALAFVTSRALLQVIARIGRLQKLNGSVISAAERQDAEIRYLRRATGRRLQLIDQLVASLALQDASVCSWRRSLDCQGFDISRCPSGDLQQSKAETQKRHSSARIQELQERCASCIVNLVACTAIHRQDCTKNVSVAS